MDAKSFLTAALFAFACPAAGSPAASKAPSACMKSYRNAHETTYKLTREDWDYHCSLGLKPSDILGLAKEKCRDGYELKQAAPIGLTRKQWDSACDSGMSGLSPDQYLHRKRKEYVLQTPAGDISPNLAYLFVHIKDPDPSPEVRAKREELKALLSRATAVRERAGSSGAVSDWLDSPLGELGDETAFAKLASRFDQGGERSALGAATAAAAPSAQVRRQIDLRPAKPLRSMGGVDRGDWGPDAPERVRERIRAEIDSLSRRVDEKGRPLYDDKAVAIMREVVDSVPINKGRPPRTDRVALEDARRAIESVSLNETRIKFEPSLDSAGDLGAFFGADGKLSLHEKPGRGLSRSLMRLRPGPRKTPGEFSVSKLAGTFIHEAFHVDTRIQQGGANAYTDETKSFQAQYRYYSNKQQDFDERIRDERAKLESLRPKLTLAEVGEGEERIAALERRRENFLDEVDRDLLESFQNSPETFRLDVVSRYYGGEIKAGQLTVAQQKKAAATQLADAKGLQERIRAELDLEYLERDAYLARKMKEADRRWREDKTRECEDLLKADPEVDSLDRRIDEIAARLETPGLGKNESFKLRFNLRFHERKREDIFKSHVSCRIAY